jgi:predicted metal-dependent hydrolase
VQITVDRGGELLISAPEDCTTRVMEDFVREKRFWIYTKLAEKDALAPVASKKQYVSGEGFAYLGRSYRLLLVDAQDVPVKLEGGRSKMLRSAAGCGRDHMVHWYSERGQVWIDKRVASFQRRVGVEPSSVTVQDLGYRWGSCGQNG